MSKRYKGFIRPIPPKLKELIALVNLIPPESNLPPLNVKTVIASQDDLWVGRDDEWLTQANLALEARLEGLPENFRRYVWPQPLERFDMFSADGGKCIFFRPPQSSYYEIAACDPDPIEVTFKAIERYRDFDRWHKDLHRLTRHASGLMRDGFNPRTDLVSVSFLIPIRGSAEITIDEHGIIQVNKDFFSKAIESVELIRIRECKVCKLIFWAGRITQKCCSKRCANTFRVHRYRYKTNEEKAAYLHRRMTREEKRQKEAQKKEQSTKKGK